MAFKYLDHEADIGIWASGRSLEEAFCEGAKAMFNLMVDINTVEPIKSISVEVSAPDIPSLFTEFLNELLLLMDTTGNVFSNFGVRIARGKEGYLLHGTAKGEPLRSEKHNIKTEVKAATYSGLKYWKAGGTHNLRCVLDL